MPKRIFVIKANKIINTNRCSYLYMLNSGVPVEQIQDLWDHWGFIQLREKDPNEIDPFKFVRGEPEAIGPDGVKKWDINVFDSKGFIFAGHVEESAEDEGLQKMISDLKYDCVLLMDAVIFERFSKAAQAIGIQVSSFHFPGSLSTS